MNDLPKAALVLNEAYKYLILKGEVNKEFDDAPGDPGHPVEFEDADEVKVETETVTGK